jgi:hypothetical protein
MWIRSGEVVFDGINCIKIQLRHSSMHTHCSGIAHARTAHFTQMAKPDFKKMRITWVQLSDTSMHVVLLWGLYPVYWGIIQVGKMLKWCISYSHLRIFA